MPQKLLRLYGRNLLHHLGALLGALAPIVTQLCTHRVGWPEAAALSTGVVAVWLVTNAHVSGKLAASIATDLQGLVSGAGGGGTLMADLEKLAAGLLGGGVPAFTGPPTGPPPAGMEGLFPSGQPSHATATATVDVEAKPATIPPGSIADGPA